MKIAIIGYSGSGKSTLAKKLSERFKIPVLYLDTINFESHWKERDREEAKAMVKDFMNNESWVIDGNYKDFHQERRMKEADKIIFMNFPRRKCFKQAYSRYLNFKNKVRESIAEGCEEKFDLEFIKWILFTGRSKKYKQRYLEICNKYKGKVIICKNLKEVKKLDEVLY
ncbi:DNA topology modulation protein [Clostridium butyricum]|uniref:DNA topology modulation protein n=1 Tax=Clostridium TaxID=1485 RepID=UPI0002CBBF78|nr:MULTISPECIES: DNA topology modulation protein [Clostridium]ETI91405.1 MAG: Topology modulation protein [Clostridium butyricum DORA_1]APF24847.1 phosphoribulokinase / Uridine kinase family protein [Clostridium butyricum]EMU54093.1 topology modulation protein [Clostridium butyricum DKU-01]MBS5981919.1 DNA topology modulation protein [Clostridium butyricum]MBZ0311483.1 DNA topology modulation protein [Clostridium butyricum]